MNVLIRILLSMVLVFTLLTIVKVIRVLQGLDVLMETGKEEDVPNVVSKVSKFNSFFAMERLTVAMFVVSIALSLVVLLSFLITGEEGLLTLSDGLDIVDVLILLHLLESGEMFCKPKIKTKRGLQVYYGLGLVSIILSASIVCILLFR